jgi:proteasome lid subunit RPN8/RPN11
VTAIAYYSDLDPHSLTGGIDFHADGYTKLAKICDEQELIVVADIHTHPLTAGQSRIDRQHPMIAIRGHIALISPNYAQGRVGLEDLSAYLYQGNGDWEHARTVELIRHPRIRDLVSVTAKKRAP